VARRTKPPPAKGHLEVGQLSEVSNDLDDPVWNVNLERKKSAGKKHSCVFAITYCLLCIAGLK